MSDAEMPSHHFHPETSPEAAMTETPGELLHKARTALGITIEQVSEKLRINHQLVVDLEQDDYSRISAKVYLQGYLQNYAELVKVPAEQIKAALERLDWQEPIHEVTPLVLKLPRYFEKRSQQLALSKKKTLILVVLLLVLLVLGIFYYNQIRHSATDLITKPTETTVTSNRGVALKIKTVTGG